MSVRNDKQKRIKQPIFKFKGKLYSYVTIDDEIIIYRVDNTKPEDDFEFDKETQKQLELEFAVYEATLSEEELKAWRGEE